MNGTRKYLVPDYYPRFQCKMGACRSACCIGWPVSLSMTDYFKLVGVDCSKALRARIDCAMHLVDHPTRERYARITPRYDGNCPLRLPDGRCGVQAELGEDALSDVCRLYPRGIRGEGDDECSCANSCEAVLELLFAKDEPIAFQTIALPDQTIRQTERSVYFETVGREQEIRLYLIRQIQNRAYPMPERIMVFGQALKKMDLALRGKDAARVAELLSGAPVGNPEKPALSDQACLALGLPVAKRMVEQIDQKSVSVRGYGEAALKYFGEGAAATARYQSARAHFEQALPRWQIYFEHMLVNHMFFERFPFQDRPESLLDEYLALCAVYALIRFLGLGWMADKTDPRHFVDAAAAAFRLIDHTAFDRYAAHMLKDMGMDDPVKIHHLIAL